MDPEELKRLVADEFRGIARSWGMSTFMDSHLEGAAHLAIGLLWGEGRPFEQRRDSESFIAKCVEEGKDQARQLEKGEASP